MCAAAPMLTSGIATTGVTLSGALASPFNRAAGIVADQLPSDAGVTDTGALAWVPSLAETATPVASGCATPETAIGPSVIVLGALVIAFLAHGATEAQPEIGPGTAFGPGGATTTLVELEVPPPKNPPVTWVSVIVSPGCRLGVSAFDRAPFCQQSPEEAGVGVVVFTEKGVYGLPVPEN
jgi:hypothetical protein